MKINPLDEGGDAWGVEDLFRVSVSPLGRVAEEGCVTHVVSFLPVPIFGVPLEVNNETRFKDPEDVGFLTWSREVFGDPECCFVALLGEHSNRFVARQGDGDILRAGRLDAAGGGSPSVLPGVGRGFYNLIDPVRGCISGCFSLADPVAVYRHVVGGGWDPGNAIDDELSILPIECVEACPYCG